MYVAYETLSEPLRQFVGELRAVHSFAEKFLAGAIQSTRDGTTGAMRSTRSTRRFHIRRSHEPATGRKALFVNQDFTSHIEGLSPSESDAPLRLLFEHMARPSSSSVALAGRHRGILG